MTFEKAMGRISNDPDTMEDLVKKKTESTGSTGSKEVQVYKIRKLFYL